MKVLKALLVVSLISVSSAYMIRSAEDIRKREEMLRNVDSFAEIFSQEYANFTRTGLRSDKLNKIMEVMRLPVDFARVEPEEMSIDDAIMSCVFCRSTVALMLNQYRTGQRTKEELIQDSIGICMQLTTYGIEVCSGIIRAYADPLLYVVDARPSLTANQMCSMILQGECGDPDQSFNFHLNISPGPPITQSKSGSTPRNPNELRILHLSDPHYDPNYLVNGFANCPEPTCCRRSRGIAPDPADRAGRWGDFRNCDSPWEVVEDAVRAARANHPQIDMVYITGDYIDHGIWEKSQQGSLEIWDRFYNLVQQVFPGIPVYPVMGNHEANPTNVFAPPHVTDPSVSSHWLYEYHATAWMRFLPPSTQATIRRGGYYTVLHSPGFRIIGLNNNDCQTYNFWNMYSRDEVINQLNWLHNTLLAAEAAGERVHILTHIFPGGGACFRWWSQNYRRVIERFHRIISGQFYGHSHRDEFNVFYANDNLNFAINSAWNGGATTTYSNYNPNYVLYYVDRILFQVNEKESWMYSITEANANPATPPRWFRVSSFRDEFRIPDLSPASLDHWITNTLSRDRATLRRFRDIRYSLAEPRINPPCDDNCLRGTLCTVVRNEFGDNRKCDQLSQFPLQ